MRKKKKEKQAAKHNPLLKSTSRQVKRRIQNDYGVDLNKKTDLSDVDPLKGEELLYGLMEYDFQLWRCPKDVAGSGMERSSKSSITGQWVC